MSTDADANKVGLIPVTLMVSGNIMGSGFFCCLPTWRQPAGLLSTDGLSPLLAR